MEQLKALAGAMTSSPEESLRRLLILACEQLSMDLAFVGQLDGDSHRVVRQAVTRHGSVVAEAVGLREALVDSWCGRVLDGDGLLIGEVSGRDDLLRLPTTSAFDIQSYAGVTLQDEAGRPVGTLCALGHQPHDSLNPRDLATLRAIGEVLVPLLRELDKPHLPLPRDRPSAALPIATVASTVSDSTDVETLSRPLLDLLHDLTGLASTYLTVIDEERGMQEIRFSHNTLEGFALPEGLHVPWDDTLCKRSLEEGRPCTLDVPAVWGDSDAAAALGIQVYVSVPIALSDGRVWGTLCAADSRTAEGVEEHLDTLRLFARLVSAQVERDSAVERAQLQALLARSEADTDALTGCASRRVVEPWLATNLGDLEPEETVLVAFVDLDRFKGVNDEHGHAAGDLVLTAVAHHLRAAARPGDLVARWGGDEFVVAARLPRRAASDVALRLRADRQVRVEALGLDITLSIGTALSESHLAHELLGAADRAMYAVKRARA